MASAAAVLTASEVTVAPEITSTSADCAAIMASESLGMASPPMDGVSSGPSMVTDVMVSPSVVMVTVTLPPLPGAVAENDCSSAPPEGVSSPPPVPPPQALSRPSASTTESSRRMVFRNAFILNLPFLVKCRKFHTPGLTGRGFSVPVPENAGAADPPPSLLCGVPVFRN